MPTKRTDLPLPDPDTLAPRVALATIGNVRRGIDGLITELRGREKYLSDRQRAELAQLAGTGIPAGQQ